MEKREIKFRAWDTLENKMNTIGCLGAGSGCQYINLGFDGSLTLCNAYGLPDGTNPAFDKPVTERFILMQYTGLKDKNGKEIYEGDIVRNDMGGWNVVVYKAPCFEASISKEQSCSYSLEWWNKVEVTGSIFETPSTQTK